MEGDDDVVSRRRLMAEAAEARFAKLSRPSAHPPHAPPHTASVEIGPPAASSASTAPVEIAASASGPPIDPVQQVPCERMDAETATRLFTMVFGVEPPLPQVMGQWSRQGFRFQSAPPSAVLVQVRSTRKLLVSLFLPATVEWEARVALYPLHHQLSYLALARLQHTQSQGGPCGVLAPLQALLLKHLLFDGAQPIESSGSGSDALAVPPPLAQRALLRALEEALWGCGGAPRGEALVASLLPTDLLDDALPADGSCEVLIDSAPALHSLVRALPCRLERPCAAPPHTITPSPHARGGGLSAGWRPPVRQSRQAPHGAGGGDGEPAERRRCAAGAVLHAAVARAGRRVGRSRRPVHAAGGAAVWPRVAGNRQPVSVRARCAQRVRRVHGPGGGDEAAGRARHRAGESVLRI